MEKVHAWTRFQLPAVFLLPPFPPSSFSSFLLPPSSFLLNLNHPPSTETSLFFLQFETTMRAITLLALAALACAASAQLVNTNVDREIDLTNHLVTIITKQTISNKGSQDVSSVELLHDDAIKNKLSYLSVVSLFFFCFFFFSNRKKKRIGFTCLFVFVYCSSVYLFIYLFVCFFFFSLPLGSLLIFHLSTSSLVAEGRRQ